MRARPDSLAYRTGRFVARHRVAVAVAIVATTALAALTVSSVASSRAAQREREIAERQRTAAAREAERAEAVVDLVVELFGGLDPIAGADLDTVRVSDLIALGEAKAARLVGEPEIQARLRHTLGRIQLERSDWKSALALLAAARDVAPASGADDDLAAVQLELDYARALHSTGDRAGAAEIARGVLERVESSGAARHDGAPDPFLHATALATLGAFEGGETGEARLVRALAILRALPQVEPTEIAAVCTSLGWLRSMRGAKDEARALFTEALAILREERGPTHPHTLGLESTLASLLADPAERLREHERILAVRRGKLGDRHYMVANSWSAIGKAKLELRDFAAAAEAYDLAATIWVETAGDSHPMAQAAFRNRDRARTAARTGELPPPPEQAHGRR